MWKYFFAKGIFCTCARLNLDILEYIHSNYYQKTTLMEPQTFETSVLTNFESILVRADTGKRFLNYIIDLVCFFLLAVAVAIVGVVFWGEDFANSVEDPNPILDRLVTLLMYAIYMFVQEAIFKGRSIGKFITGTKAVYLDGSTINTITALKRGFSRAVPFAVFSAFGNPCDPWWDRWTDTQVIDIKKSAFLSLD
jgi:hypothetical protein